MLRRLSPGLPHELFSVPPQVQLRPAGEFGSPDSLLMKPQCSQKHLCEKMSSQNGAQDPLKEEWILLSFAGRGSGYGSSFFSTFRWFLVTAPSQSGSLAISLPHPLLSRIFQVTAPSQSGSVAVSAPPSTCPAMKAATTTPSHAVHSHPEDTLLLTPP